MEKMLNGSHVAEKGQILQLTSGTILVLVGIAMITGTLTSFGTWLLMTFPVFQYVVL